MAIIDAPIKTVRDLYEWAKENNCLDTPIYKHCNFDIHEIRAVCSIEDVPAYNKMVVID